MASEKDTLMNRVSKIISKALSLPGFSRYGTLLSQNYTLILDYLYSIVLKPTEKCHGGSTAEGTATAESDLDQMIVLPNITVHTAQMDFERVTGCIFLLETSGSRPGFGRLRLVKLDDTAYHHWSLLYFSFEEVLLDTNDGTYLSSDKFVNFFISKKKTRHTNDPSISHYQHGPCAMSEVQDIFGFAMGRTNLITSNDEVYALLCGQYPVEAKEWITRDRLHDWPSKEVVDKISHQKCHVVPVGDARSSFVSLEWRISFLLWERELVWNFNNTQVQCYVLLKMLLKMYIEPLAPDQLSSYHMKTIMFWLSEEKGLSMWYDENLLQCVVESLNMLKSCIVEGELQHYFHRQRNLLTYKLEDVSEKERVLLKIDEMQEDIVTHVLKCMPKSELSEQWLVCNGNITKFIDVIKRVPLFYDDYELIQDFKNKINLHEKLFTIFMCISLEEVGSFQVFHQLIQWEENHPKNLMPLFQEMTKLFLYIRVGIEYFEHTKLHKDTDFEEYMKDISFKVDDPVQLVQYALDIDYMSGALYLATVYLSQGKYLESNGIVLCVLSQNKTLIYPCPCSRNKIIQLPLEGNVKQGSSIYLPGEEGLTDPAYDVIFSFQDLHLVPYPVKFECALTKYEIVPAFTIHPCVYAYCVLCIGQYYVGSSAPFQILLSRLDETVRETIGGHQRYRALNILGVCYTLDGNLKEAFRCFKESLEETRYLPFAKNAAVYHIGILIVHLLEAKEKEDIVYMRK